MNAAAATEAEAGVAARVEGFTASRERFGSVLAFLDGAQAAAVGHAEPEERLRVASRELFRRLYRDHLDLRAQRETRVAVLGADGAARPRVETGHTRTPTTVFGEVEVARIAYRAPARPDLHPADAPLDLPPEPHFHGLRRLAAVEATRGSYDDAVAGITQATGQRLGKRQVEQLAARAAVDVDAFHTLRRPPPAPGDDVLVLSCDGKGIVMRADALRPPPRRPRPPPSPPPEASKGEERNRRPMAEVGTVYDAAPAVRTPADILPAPADDGAEPAPGPATTNKRPVASVIDNTADVVAQISAETGRRDPHHSRTPIALVDGDNHQINPITTEARARDVPITTTTDFIHVLEYVSAPRGARLYPPLSGERLEGASLGPMPYLALKKKGDRSMALNQWSRPGVWGGALGDPRDMAKARLPESQFPEGAIRRPPERHLKPAPPSAPGPTGAWRNPFGARSDAQ